MPTKKKSETAAVAEPVLVVDDQIATIIRIEGVLDKISKKAIALEDDKFYNGAIKFAADGVNIKYYNAKSAKVGTLADLEAQVNGEWEKIQTRKPTKITGLTNYGDTASVSSKGITVGCRTITFAKFDALAEIVTDFRERQAAAKAARGTGEKKAAKKTSKKTAAKKTAKATKKTTKNSNYYDAYAYGYYD